MPDSKLMPETEPQARISCGSAVATTSCLDTLRLSMWVDWESSNLLDRLEVVKNLAQQGEYESEPVDLAGHSWNVMRSGTSRFTFRLVRGDIQLLINRRKADGSIPNTRLEIGSASCWSPGFRTIYNEVVKLIELYGGAVCKERVSEVHLATDFIGQDLRSLPVAKMEHWITRAYDFQPHYSRRKLTGVSVGKGDFMLRCYDKVRELKTSTSKQQLFTDVWGVKAFDEKPVTRVEFQLRRPVLRDFAPIINTLEELEDCLDSLWQYCCQHWGRLTVDEVDRNHHQSRAQTHPFWLRVQGVVWEGAMFVARVKRYIKKDLYRLTQLAAGVSMTIAALYGRHADDIEGVIACSTLAIECHLRDLFKTPEDFRKRMSRKINDSLPFQPSFAAC